MLSLKKGWINTDQVWVSNSFLRVHAGRVMVLALPFSCLLFSACCLSSEIGALGDNKIVPDSKDFFKNWDIIHVS